MVHENLRQCLLAERGEEEKLELGWESAKRDVGWGKEGDKGSTTVDRVSGSRLLLIVVILEELSAVKALDGRGQGGEGVGEEEGLVKDRPWGDEGVVQRVEVTVGGLDVSNEDLGVKVELDGYEMSTGGVFRQR